MKKSLRKIFTFLFVASSLFSNVSALALNSRVDYTKQKDSFRDLIVILDDGNEHGPGAVTITLLSAISNAQYPILVSSTVWSNFVNQKLACQDVVGIGRSKFLDHIDNINNRIDTSYNSLSKKGYIQSRIKKIVAEDVNREFCSIEAIEGMAKSGKLIDPEECNHAVYFLCYFTPFDNQSWEMYQVSKDFYLLIPVSYLRACGIEKHRRMGGDKITTAERALGLKIDHLRRAKNPLDKKLSDSLRIGERPEGEFVSSLRKLFVENNKYNNWNIYLVGHGNNSDFAGGWNDSCIANLKIREFQLLLNFLNSSISTNMLVYTSCFAGGQHLIDPYKSRGKSVCYNYPIVVTCLADEPCMANLVYLNMVSLGGKITEHDIWKNKTTGKWELKLIDEANDWSAFFNGIHRDMHGKNCDTQQLLDVVQSINAKVLSNTPWIRLANDDHFRILACPKNCAKISVDLVNAQKKIGGFIEFKDSSIQHLFVITPVVSVPVIFSSRDCCPKILSLVPGDATHNFVNCTSMQGFTTLVSCFTGLTWLCFDKTYLIKQLKCANDLSTEHKKYLGLTIDGMVTLNDVIVYRKGKNPYTIEVVFRISTSKTVYSAEISFYGGCPELQAVHPFDGITGMQYSAYVKSLEKKAFDLLQQN